MNGLAAYLALRAADERRAVAKATRRHIHLSNRPLVIVGYHLAGDVGAPLALMWGTDPDKRPRTAVVPEPRNRDLRFEALTTFGVALVDYLAAYSEMTIERGSRGQHEPVCVDAPQVIVPNRATAEWLFGVVGRFTRHLSTDGNPSLSPVVPQAGQHLSFFHDLLPGSSRVLAATEVLSSHWQTGQLASEDLNLSALLGWIEPPEGADGVAAARMAEALPPAGPLSDPNWDERELAGLINQWRAARTDVDGSVVRGEIDTQIREQLNHTWEDCWHAHRLLAALPEGNTVACRWQRDRKDWTRHRATVEAGTARFRNVPTPVQTARTLRFLEDATTDLKTDMALDDPLVMAAYVVSGEALSARVMNIDTDRMIPGPKRPVCRPLMTLEPLMQFMRPAGTVLFLTSAPEVELEVLSATQDVVHVQVNRGALTRRTFDRLPNPGDNVLLSPFGKRAIYPPPQYDEVPWTHRLPEPNVEHRS